MDNAQDIASGIEIDGLSVKVELGTPAASLRYFDSTGSFATLLREAVGRPLPEPLRAVSVSVNGSTHDGNFILAWRSPTETVLLGGDQAAIAALERRLAGAMDGCLVNQTGGLCVFRVRGPKALDLLPRLAANSAIPALGEARSGRWAELHVLALCVQPGEFLLLVERVYADHLSAWIRTTVADF